VVLALSTQDTVFNLVLGLAMVVGWVVLFALWWFVFRKAPRDGSQTPHVVAGAPGGEDQDPRSVAIADPIEASRASIASEPADGR
jgi:predicted secreted protein